MRTLSNSNMKWIIDEFKKCLVVCANCHRELHHPDLAIVIVQAKILEFGDVIEIKRPRNQPRCIDCSKEINYKSKRCKPCRDINIRKKGRPTKALLIIEVQEYGRLFCAEKYGVIRQTIGKWLNKDT